MIYELPQGQETRMLFLSTEELVSLLRLQIQAVKIFLDEDQVELAGVRVRVRKAAQIADILFQRMNS